LITNRQKYFFAQAINTQLLGCIKSRERRSPRDFENRVMTVQGLGRSSRVSSSPDPREDTDTP
jgi:hypothetical protein